nr:PREDICTED: inhibitor of apoptosis protein-like [Linepithema humile]
MEIKFPMYSKINVRRQSFATWPLNENVSSVQLSYHGFFFVGTHDIVTCYTCGVTLEKWNKNLFAVDGRRNVKRANVVSEDNGGVATKKRRSLCDPLVEHIYWSPDCPLILRYRDQPEWRTNNPRSTRRSDNNTDVMFVSLSASYGSLVNTTLRDYHTLKEMKGQVDVMFGNLISFYRKLATELDVLYQRMLVATKGACACSHTCLVTTNRRISAIAACLTALRKTRRISLRDECLVDLTTMRRNGGTTAPSSPPLSCESCSNHHCVVCRDALSDILFLPCGHLKCCLNCAVRITTGECPLCRGTVFAMLRVYV